MDQLALVQKEVQLSVQDLDKTKKLYFDEEHSAHDVRDKARDIEEKFVVEICRKKSELIVVFL